MKEPPGIETKPSSNVVVLSVSPIEEDHVFLEDLMNHSEWTLCPNSKWTIYRPKQFCRLLGGKSLLAQTRQRIARSIPRDQTVFVLMSSHEGFYAEELESVPAAQMVVQPSNRGTLPAILCSLLQIVRVDEQAVVAFFPSDHHYSDEGNFVAGVELAFGAAESNPEFVVLLGAPATHAETDYEWIEAEAAISTHSHNGLLRVKRFWEKPSLKVAKDLLDRGCVWNTFVMVGQARAFLDMIQSRAAELYEAFAMRTQRAPEMDAEAIEGVYEGLVTAGFSGLVLSATSERLGILCLGDVGWSDLGDPQRLIEVLSRTCEENEWVTLLNIADAVNVTCLERRACG